MELLLHMLLCPCLPSSALACFGGVDVCILTFIHLCLLCVLCSCVVYVLNTCHASFYFPKLLLVIMSLHVCLLHTAMTSPYMCHCMQPSHVCNPMETDYGGTRRHSASSLWPSATTTPFYHSTQTAIPTCRHFEQPSLYCLCLYICLCRGSSPTFYILLFLYFIFSSMAIPFVFIVIFILFSLTVCCLLGHLTVVQYFSVCCLGW